MSRPIVEVSIYNDAHRVLLKKTPNYSEIVKLEKSGLSIDQDLLIYCLFKEQQDRVGYRTFDDFKERLNRRMTFLEDYLVLNTTSINAQPDVKEVPKEISEYLGVGVALKLISEIHNLTEADWNIIPETKHPDLDFEIATDGKNVFEVECKGTFNDASRYKMKADIEKKKKYQRNKKNNNHYLYGVITSYFSESKKPAHAYVLDPEPVNITEEPLKFQLLTRLKYYLFHLNLISKSHLLTALANKISNLENSSDFKLLSKVSLKNASGYTMKFPSSIKNKINFGIQDLFGDVICFTESSYLFIGFCSDLIQVLIDQDFDELVDFSVGPRSIYVSGEIKVKEINYPYSMFEDMPKEDYLTLNGTLHMCSSGRIVGRLFNESNKLLKRNKSSWPSLRDFSQPLLSD